MAQATSISHIIKNIFNFYLKSIEFEYVFKYICFIYIFVLKCGFEKEKGYT